MARFFGDLDAGLENLEGPLSTDGKRVKLGEFCNEFTDADVHALPNAGNDPTFRYILRGRKWQGGE